MRDIEHPSHTEELFRESIDIEKKVVSLLSKLPRYRPLRLDQLDQLDDLPLGDRLELLETVRIVIDNMNAHVQDLEFLRDLLEGKPKLKVASPSGLLISDIHIRDILSAWDQNQRSFYYVVGIWMEEAVVLVVKLKKDLTIDGRMKKGYSCFSHKLSPFKLKLAKLEKRNVSVKDIGADGELIDRWRRNGYTDLEV